MFRPFLISVAVILFSAVSAQADAKLINRPGLPLRPEPVEVRLVDGSTLFVTLDEEWLDVTTPYGRLRIRLAEVVKIEFGLRAPAEAARRVEAALAVLASADDKKAEAWPLLAGAKEFAYPALRQLARDGDRAVAARANELLAALRKSTPAERLARVGRDVIHTETSRIAGHIESAEFRALTPHFGALKLRVGDLARLTQGESGEPDEVPVNVQPDPGYLSNFQHQVGQSFYFRVTGRAGGSVWGTDVYTTDSALAAAAVHAGVLKMGETGVVKVTILAGQNAYAGSTRNGITTSGYGPYPGSYKVSKLRKRNED